MVTFSKRNTSTIFLLISFENIYPSYTFQPFHYLLLPSILHSSPLLHLSLFFIYFYPSFYSSIPLPPFIFLPTFLYLPAHSQFFLLLVRLVTCTPIARSITNSNSHSPPISRFQPPLSGPPTHLPAPSRRLFPDRPSARADSLRSKRRTFPGKHRRPSPPCIIPRPLHSRQTIPVCTRGAGGSVCREPDVDGRI